MVFSVDSESESSDPDEMIKNNQIAVNESDSSLDSFSDDSSLSTIKSSDL
jgi:hypothetical protein